MLVAVLEYAAAIFLALLFALAAEHKLRAPHVFAERLREYAPLPARAALPVAFAMGLGEAVLCIGLAPRSAPAFIAAASLLAIYLAAMGVQLARGRRDLDCGCIAANGPQRLHPALLLRNLGLIGLALFAYPDVASPLGAAGLLLSLATGASLFLLWLAAQQLSLNGARLA
jgi:hypothetical protein